MASSYGTASISPTANRLVVLTVYNEKANPTTVPTVTGAGMTWTNFFSRESTSKNTKRITMFRALSSSPGSGGLTISFGGTNQALCGWNITEFAGIDTGGTNGANAIVQSAGNDNNTSGNTGLTVTLAAFSNASNATHGVVAWGSATAITQGSGFTELGETTAPNVSYESQWRNDNDTTVDWTWASATDSSLGCSIEIAADVATTSTSITTSTSTTSTSSSTTTSSSTSTSTTVSVTISTSTTSSSTSTTTTSTSTTTTSTSTTTTSTSTTSTSTTLDLKFSVERI